MYTIISYQYMSIVTTTPIIQLWSLYTVHGCDHFLTCFIDGGFNTGWSFTVVQYTDIDNTCNSTVQYMTVQ